jgi:hypothetical protein
MFGNLCDIKMFIVSQEPVVLTQEAEIRRIMVQSQPRQIVCKTLRNPILKKPIKV